MSVLENLDGIRADGLQSRVKVFTGKDFHLWKFQFLTYAEVREVEGYFDGSIAKPGEDASEDEKKKWKKGDGVARNILLTALDYNQMQLVTNCGTGREMWERIKQKYEKESLSSQSKLRKEFHNLKKGDRKLETYIKEFDSLCDKMRGVGLEVSNNEKVLQLTEGLDDMEYDVIVTNILDAEDIQYEEACGKLLIYEARHQKTEGDSMEGESFFGQRGRGRGRGRSGRGAGRSGSRGGQRGGRGSGETSERKCYNCKETGHYAADCKKPPRCYECMSSGHKSYQCPSRGNSTSNTSKPEGGQGGVYNVELVEEPVKSQSEVRVGEANLANPARSTWIVDSGCTQHMCNQEEFFTSMRELEEKKIMMMGNGDRMEINSEGDVGLKVVTNQGIVYGTFKDVLYSPEIRRNLVSVTKMMKQGISTVFDEETRTCYLVRGKVWFNLREVVGTAVEKKDLWVLDERGKTRESGESYVAEQRDEEKMWHLRLGHLGGENLKKLVSKEMVNGLQTRGTFNPSNDICEGCMKGRQTREVFPSAEHRGRQLLELVHSDVCGPINPKSLGGNRYYLTFVDDYSRKSWVYLLKEKREVLKYFKLWKAVAEKQSEKKLKIFRTDRGGEYLSTEFKTFLSEEGIVHQTTTAGTPQQNGVAERLNRTLQEKARSMMVSSGVSGRFWGEAVMCACYLRNRSPSRVLTEEKTPEQMWSGWKPSVAHLKVFGCKCYVWIPEKDRKKMDERSWTGMFVGYSTVSKGYRVFNPSNGKVVISRDVRFAESETYYPLEAVSGKFQDEGRGVIPEEVEFESTVTSQSRRVSWSSELEVRQEPAELAPVPDEEVEQQQGDQDTVQREQEESRAETVDLRRSTREKKAPEKLTASELGELHSVYGYCHLAVAEEPATMRLALQSEHKAEWEQALAEEHRSIEKAGTYELVDRPKGRKILRSKYVLKIKRNQDGSINKFKVRLVILGNMQVEGEDYTETFAPVMKYQSLRTILALACEEGMHIHQMDVKTAFLNGDLNEEVYMEPPEYLKTAASKNKVWKLRRALYGLKQAPRAWNTRLHLFLEGQGFTRSLFDTAIYLRGEGKSRVILSVYVDDLLIVSSDLGAIERVKRKLKSEFDMVDFGEASSILGIQITRNLAEGWLELDQKRYVEVILDKFGMSECRGVVTPLEPNVKFSKAQEPSTKEEKQKMEDTPYRQAIGSLMYLMVSTRPDIASSIQVFAKYMQNPGIEHWEGVKRVFRYLKTTMRLCLRYEREGSTQVRGYCDSDYAGDLDTMRSTAGYVFLLAGGAISWSSKRQQIVAVSSTEAEYMAATHASKEALWLKRFVSDLGWEQSTVKVFCDNQSALKMMKNPTYHARTKHISVQYHFIRELIEAKELVFQFVGTNLQCADFLTKGVTREKLELFRFEVGLRTSQQVNTKEHEDLDKGNLV